MKIYSISTSKEPIDIIVERVLLAYVAKSGEYAIVTIDDDKRDVEEIGKKLEIKNMEENHFMFYFSPTKIVCGLEYILGTDEERENNNELIKEFKQSFYDSVIGYYENGNKITRAEAVRIIWGDFNSNESIPYDGVNEEEVVLLQRAAEESVVERRITNKFVDLIIKYAIHITMWEQRYSAHEANKMIEAREEKQQERGIEPYIPDRKTVLARFSFLFSGEPKMKHVKDPEYIITELSESGMKVSAKQVQDNIYTELKLHKDAGNEKHNRFFVVAKKEGIKRNTVYTSLLGQLLFVNYIDYKILSSQKKMEFFLEDDFVGDISEEIEKMLNASIEIVLMMNMLINEVDFKDMEKHPFVKKTMELHVDVLPVVKYLMAMGVNGGDIKERLVEIDDQPKIKEKIKKKRKERIDKLKDENYGATIMGGYYMFASSDEEVIVGTQYKDVRARAKRREKDYWEERYQCLKKWEYPERYQVKTDLVCLLMRYLKTQNQAIHNRIKEILGVYVE